MAARRVFWRWGLILVSLVYPSLLIGNKHSKHINNKNRAVQHLLDPVQTQDETDITGYRFGVEDSHLQAAKCRIYSEFDWLKETIGTVGIVLVISYLASLALFHVGRVGQEDTVV